MASQLNLTRLPGWERRLALVTEKHIALPGEWGVSDCGLTVGEAVEAVTGTNPLAEFVGRYKTELGAARHMKRKGWNDMADVLASFFPETGRLMARRGDVGAVMQGGALTAGYVCEYGFAAKGPRGLIFHDLTEIVTAYRVG